MNILFLLKSLEIGGVEVVTAVLANEFIKHGHNVCVWSFLKGKNSIANRFDDNIKIYTGNNYSKSTANVNNLREILKNNNVDIVINQWGLPLVPIKTLREASKGLDIKIISVYHNAPSFNGRISQMNIKLLQTTSLLIRIFLILMKKLVTLVTSRAMKYIYNKSDKFLILSESYIEDFRKYTKIKNTFNLVVIANPITIDNATYPYDFNEKEKEIIYVGRLDFLQKRVHRIIDTWKFLEAKFPEWRLTIVGDGDERENLEKQVEMLGLSKVHFEGYKAPNEYYRRASILILTSEYEGFPLVLAECMSFGVVPIVYGSYAAVYDIIEDGKDGIILPFDKETGFNAAKMAERMAVVMTSPEILQTMSAHAVEKSKKYSIDKIVSQWEQVMNTLISK